MPVVTVQPGGQQVTTVLTSPDLSAEAARPATGRHPADHGAAGPRPGVQRRPVRGLACLADEVATGFSAGLVTDVLAADYPTLAGHIAYVCGPPGMVDGALRTLMGKRLFPRDIYREEFLDEGDKATGGMRSPLLRH